MLPLLRDGDIVTVTPADPAQLRIGDVICYEMLPGRVVVHRVIAHARDGVLAKGDALSTSASVQASEVLGTVTTIERSARVRRLDTPAARVRNWVMALISRRTPLVPMGIDVARQLRAAARG